MNYLEALSYTHSLLRFGSRPGLERINALLSALSDPQKKISAIHVAGTNGKGSVCAAASSILTAAGYKTGLFISPYITDFRERIQIDSNFVSEREYAAAAQTVRDAVKSLPESLCPTEFEFVTAVALTFFAREKCDVAVLETGLGGRLDSTNVLERPLSTVITSISRDHMAVLGNTLSQIAGEKCGIIRPGCPVITPVSQPDEAMRVIKETADRLSCKVIIPDISKAEIKSDTLDGCEFEYDGMRVFRPLAGSFQLENTLLAIEAVKASGMRVSDKDIVNGIKNMHHPARFEVKSRDPLIILDGAHNDGGALSLKRSLEKYLPEKRLFGICGMLRDKEYSKALSHLTPLFDELITVTPTNLRALDAKELADNLAGQVPVITPEVIDGDLIPKAVDRAGGRPIIIFGSLYLAGEIYKYL